MILPGLVTFVGETEEQAKAQQRELNELLPVQHSLDQLSFSLRQDTSEGISPHSPHPGMSARQHRATPGWSKGRSTDLTSRNADTAGSRYPGDPLTEVCPVTTGKPR